MSSADKPTMAIPAPCVARTPIFGRESTTGMSVGKSGQKRAYPLVNQPVGVGTVENTFDNTCSDLVKWGVAEGASNTARPLTPTSDQSRGGLAVDASRKPSRASKNSDDTGCLPFEGPDTKWREKAVTLTWLEKGIDRVALSWPAPECGTPLCLNLDHLTWSAPRKLEYPIGICTYCGLIAGTKDHLLPRTWTGETARKYVLTVPACGECNSTIKDQFEPSITARRRIAQESIRRRKRKQLQMPDWSAKDLAEMGHNLRKLIQLGLHERDLTRARLKWPEDADYDIRCMQLSGIANPYELGLIDPPGVSGTAEHGSVDN